MTYGTLNADLIGNSNGQTGNGIGPGFKNRIINGDMRIAQRGTAAVTASNDFPVDRWKVFNSTDGAFSAQQDSSAPTGFINSVKVTATTADATLTADQNLSCFQRIEGTNIADLGWGTANAKTVTVSFWVRSSLTGTFGGSLRNNASDRSYPFTYSISVADTWEYKTVTIPGDTSGTWLTDTGTGINVFFALGAGPDRSGTAGAWAATSLVSATGAVSVIGTLNATWYITGVQLEVGSSATSFDYRPFGTELQLCQRYCVQMNESEYLVIGMADTGNNCEASVPLPVEMRTTPTLTTSGTAANYRVREPGTSNDCTSVPVILGSGGKNIAGVRFIASGAFTTGQALYAFGTTNGFLRFEAEL